MKRTFALLLAGLMLVPAMASCGSSDSKTAETAATSAATEAETEPELKPDLPDVKYNGYKVNMFMRQPDGRVADMYAEELTGETMNDAIYERNSKVGEQFGVTFAVTRGADDFGGDVVNDIIAGDDTFDFIIPHGRYTFKYATQGLLLDFNNDLKYVNVDNPWWNQDAKHEFSIAHYLFAMTGSISYANLGATSAVFFNKNMLNDYKLESPYTLVLDGKWTFDKLAEMSQKVAKDLNGDGQMVMGEDQFGLLTGGWSGPIHILYSANLRIANKDENDHLKVAVYSERSVNVYEKFFALTDSSSAHCELGSGSLSASFKAGKALFVTVSIGSAKSYREMEDDFGIIPYPKFDETVDGYHTGVDAGCNLVTVPITTKNAELDSVVLEALAYEGYKTVLPTYYDVVLSSKYTRDAESTQMLDIIREGAVLDIGYYYFASGNKFNSTGYNLANDTSHNFASFYERYKDSEQQSYDDTCKLFEEKIAERNQK